MAAIRARPSASSPLAISVNIHRMQRGRSKVPSNVVGLSAPRFGRPRFFTATPDCRWATWRTGRTRTPLRCRGSSSNGWSPGAKCSGPSVQESIPLEEGDRRKGNATYSSALVPTLLSALSLTGAFTPNGDADRQTGHVRKLDPTELEPCLLENIRQCNGATIDENRPAAAEPPVKPRAPCR